MGGTTWWSWYNALCLTASAAPVGVAIGYAATALIGR